jgi:predicted PurR-regulated permease PerM
METIIETPEPKPVPSLFQRRTLWGAITALSIVVIGAIAVGFIMLTGTVLSYLQPILVPLAVAAIIAYLLEPIIAWLMRRGWPHRRAMLVVYIAFVIFVVVLVVSVVVPTIGQAQEVYKSRDNYSEKATALVKRGIDSLQGYFETGVAKEYYDRGVEWLTTEGPKLGGEIGQMVWSRLRGAFGFFGYLLGLLLVPIYLYYFLQNGHTIAQSWSDYLPLKASKFKDEVVGTLTEINGYLISFFRGQMVVSLIDGALVAVVLTFIGLPYALLIGVFLALLGLIPYIGNLLVMIPAMIIALVHFSSTDWGVVQGTEKPVVGEVSSVLVEDVGKVDNYFVTQISPDGTQVEVLLHAWTAIPLPNVWAYPVIVLAIFFILQQINGLVTAPRIVGDSVGLHPLTVIFSVIFWSFLLGGLLGALLAVPLTAAIKVLFRRYLWERRLEAVVERRLSGLGNDDGAKDPEPPAATDEVLPAGT